MRVHLIHASLQFSDPHPQRAEDIGHLLARAERRKVLAVTFTEAGAPDQRQLVEAMASDYGYRVATRRGTDAGVAVAAWAVTGSWRPFYDKVIEAGQGVGPHGDRGVVGVSFDSLAPLGHLAVSSCHYLTHGRPDAHTAAGRANAPLNRQLARAVGHRARTEGRGKDIVFHGADQNIVDRTEDTFMGQPLTSAWDELRRWENTGHGNIDVLASYDHDGRVKAAYCRALDDRELHQHGDHFVVEAGFDVRALTR